MNLQARQVAQPAVTSSRRASQDASISNERPAKERERGGQAMVVPLARSLSILAAFTPQTPWLCNQELVLETGIPAPSVSRMLRSLVALGYAAIAHSNVQRVARLEMQSFADASESYVVLGARDRLDVIVLETCASKPATLDLNLSAGTRLRIASSPMGWAMLAALPELERFYLLGNVERKTEREWPLLRRRITEGISQVHNTGYCMSLGEWEPELAIVAAPLVIADRTPLVLACIGRSARMGRARIERELGPRLVAAAQSLQQQALFAGG